MPGAAAACEVMGVAGSGSWLVGPPPAGIWGMCRPIWLFRWPVVGPHSFMAKCCGDDMTKPNSLRRSSADSCFLRPGRVRSSRICPAKGGCAHCAHTVHNRLFDPHFDPLILALPSLLHAVLCFRRHDFAAWIVGVGGRAGFSGNVSGISAAVASYPAAECRCVGSGLFFRGRSWFG
jgi:hypothetical protein